MSKLLYDTAEWSVESIDRIWKAIDTIAKEKFGLEYCEPQLEILTADQIFARIASKGMPVAYDHWSFGKSYLQSKNAYDKGLSNVPYEMIINTNPLLTFLCEENTNTMQAAVLAHAVCGHGSMFKYNYIFKENTDPDFIMKYLKYAQKYIRKCEDTYGPEAVEKLLDHAHSLEWHGIDKSPRKRTKTIKQLKDRDARHREIDRENQNELLDLIQDPRFMGFSVSAKRAKRKVEIMRAENKLTWAFPEENILYFIEKNSTVLRVWEKEILRIVRTISQHHYPSIKTKLMHEGWATFWEDEIMKELWTQKLISDGDYVEYIIDLTNVSRGPYNKLRVKNNMPASGGYNPYYLGFKIFKEIKKICTEPTPKHLKEYPDIANTDWLKTLKMVAANYNDETFVMKFLTDDLIDELDMALWEDKLSESFTEIRAVSDSDKDYIRKALAKSYSMDVMIPRIEIESCNLGKDRILELRHIPNGGKTLDSFYSGIMLKYLINLWGFPVALNTVDENGRSIRKSRSYV